MNKDLSKDCIQGDFKVKVIGYRSVEKFENEINEFIKDKMIIDIKYSNVLDEKPYSKTVFHTAMIMYREYPF